MTDDGHSLRPPASPFGGRVLLESLAVTLLAFPLGSFVRHEYSSSPAVHDDRYFEWLIGETWNGRMSRAETTLISHSGQLTPLGALHYELFLWEFGVDHPAWHIYLNLVHGLSAGLLYALLRQYLAGWVGPAVASLLWCAVAIGRWDNFGQWLGQLTIAPTPVWLLLAMLFTARLRDHRSLWTALWVGIASLLCVLQWNIGAILLTALPAQFLLDRGWKTWRPAAILIAGTGWILAIAVGVGLTLFGLSAAHQGVPSDLLSLSRILSALSAAPALLAASAADLTFWSAARLGSEDLVGKYAVAVGIASGLFLARPCGRRAGLMFLMPVAIYCLAASVMRIDLGWDAILTSGRYFYFPTLFWCVVIGAIADGVWSRVRSAWSVPAGALLLAGLLIPHVIHQRAIASEARSQFRRLWEAQLDGHKELTQAVDALIESGSASDPVVFPEIPLAVPPVPGLYRLSTLIAIRLHGAPATVRIVPIDQMTDEERSRARRLTGTLPTELASEWVSVQRDLFDDYQTLQWLNEQAAGEGRVFRVPPVERMYGSAPVMLIDLVPIFGKNDFASLDLNGTEADRAPLKSWLSEHDSAPEARIWHRWISRRVQGLPTSGDGSR